MARKQREITVANLADFPPGSRRIVDVGGREIGVFRVGEEFYALPNLCPHQIGPLCTGRISGTLTSRKETGWQLQWVQDGEIVTCPWHGMEFHIPTGQCLAFPEIQLRQYDVVVEGEVVKLRV